MVVWGTLFVVVGVVLGTLVRKSKIVRIMFNLAKGTEMFKMLLTKIPKPGHEFRFDFSLGYGNHVAEVPVSVDSPVPTTGKKFGDWEPDKSNIVFTKFDGTEMSESE